MPDYKVTSQIVGHPGELESDWLGLQQRSECSFFQSWSWIKSWLEHIAMDLQPVAIKVWFGDNLVGLGLFVSKDIKRRIIFHSRAMLLNEYPFDGRNMVIEYNGILAAKEHENAVYLQTFQYLITEFKDYDEFVFGAIPDNDNLDYLLRQSFDGVDCNINEESITWSIDLVKVPPGINGFLSMLSKNRQGQIRRSMRLFESQAPIQIVEANNREEALLFFERLKVLHTARWQSKGKQGVFANPHWVRFHLAVINSCFDNGEIQLLKVFNEHHEIGYLYNFVWREHVYVIQTGFMQSEDKRLMPGYVTHTFSVAYNVSKGMAVYDLMHGEDLYKRILCNRQQKLVWLVLQRRRLKFSLEKFAVGMVRSIKKIAH